MKEGEELSDGTSERSRELAAKRGNREKKRQEEEEANEKEEECLLTGWFGVRFCCHRIELDTREQRVESRPPSNTCGTRAVVLAVPISRSK